MENSEVEALKNEIENMKTEHAKAIEDLKKSLVPPKNVNGIQLEEFQKMSYDDRQKLYSTDKATYDKLKNLGGK